MPDANAGGLGQWLADDLRYVHSNGQVADRGQFIASIANGEHRYHEVTPIERQVVMLGNRSALVRGRDRIQIESSSTRLDLDIRYLAVYGLDDDNR